tara:strand:- start:41812 stop:42060 length:249 start_codon:yes stop_codon:yes gene_type:complete
LLLREVPCLRTVVLKHRHHWLAIDIKDHVVDTIGPQIIEDFHKDFNVFTINNHRTVVVRLHNVGSGRLICTDCQATQDFRYL